MRNVLALLLVGIASPLVAEETNIGQQCTMYAKETLPGLAASAGEVRKVLAVTYAKHDAAADKVEGEVITDKTFFARVAGVSAASDLLTTIVAGHALNYAGTVADGIEDTCTPDESH